MLDFGLFYMKINIKTKLYTGLGFLAFIIVLQWSFGLFFISTLADNSSAIIENNKRTVTYMQNMEQVLTELHLQFSERTDRARQNEFSLQDSQIDSLRDLLVWEMKKQQQNITEPDEAEMSNSLQQELQNYFTQIDQLQSESEWTEEMTEGLDKSYGNIQGQLATITHKNLDAIQQKNDHAQQTASRVIFYMITIGVISTLMALGLLIKYPGYIVEPIRELIERIKKIADQNYDQRLEFETGDEYEELAEAFNTMATRLQEYESSNLAKLRSEKQRIEAIINQMNEVVIGLDRKNCILFVNTKAEEVLGCSGSDMIGKSAQEIAKESELMKAVFKDPERKISASENGKEKPDLVKVTSDDRFAYYSREIQPVIMQNPEHDSAKRQKIGSIITLKNVTHFQELNEAKNNFIAVVSHELKTPIASINMSLRLLEDERVGALNDEQADLIKSIGNDTNRMKKTTSELLDLSKIETGNIQINNQKARPVDLLEYASETMLMQADQKDISLKVNCDPNLPFVKADLQKTVWVLVNLIANAIRYSETGSKIVLKAEDKQRAVQFSVVDYGKGIPKEYQQKIFQKYVQISDEDSGDSGLGLAIAKEFIAAQGGSIAVESEIGEGSTFYFTLPKANKSISNDDYEA